MTGKSNRQQISTAAGTTKIVSANQPHPSAATQVCQLACDVRCCKFVWF